MKTQDTGTLPLTNSGYLAGLRCPKYLWILFNDCKKISETHRNTYPLFNSNINIHSLARLLFPGGSEVLAEDVDQHVNKTIRLLNKRKPLFDAGVTSQNIYSRIAILKPVEIDSWDIAEVKSTINVNFNQLCEMSFQKYACRQSGLSIQKCFLIYINKEYVKAEQLDPERFFSIEDVTAPVDKLIDGIQDRINIMQRILSSRECPDVPIGDYCNHPYECGLKPYCWKYLPDNNVFELYRGGKKSFELLNRGVQSIRDIPESFKLTKEQNIQKSVVVSGEPYINHQEIKLFLQSLKYPVYFLNSETINFMIPIFNGVSPYQRIPYMFSLCTIEQEFAKPKCVSFIATKTDDPRPEFLSNLKQAIGNEGSIVVYHQVFEESLLNELGKTFTDYGNWSSEVTERMADLALPFKKFFYYHPSQRGSISIRKVLSAITSEDLEKSPINNGNQATLAFQSILSQDVPKKTKEKVLHDLENYVLGSTLALVSIISKLSEITKDIPR